MTVKKSRWFLPWLALGLGVGLLILFLPSGGKALSDAAAQSGAHWAGEASVLAAGPPNDGGILSISGSSVEVQGYGCYEANKTQTLCFVVYNGSTDAEWLDGVRLTFPNYGGLGPWVASCKLQDATDSMGNPVNLTCGAGSTTNEVVYIDNDTEIPDSIGEISSGSSWGLCVDVIIPSGYNGSRILNWGLSGDGDGDLPHEITDGETYIEECMPVMLNPAVLNVEGCNGVTQTLDFELWNHHAGNDTFNLAYAVPSANGVFTGPTSFYLPDGGVVTFTTQLVPDRCLGPGQQMNATLEVDGTYPSGYDRSTITHTVSWNSGWQAQPYTSPVPSMDSAVIWASESDGGLWVIGGYGSDGATQRHNPQDGTWQTFQSEAMITPLIEYPMDACYGLNGDGDEIVVLFPDTIVTGALHIYNITQNSWITQPTPGWYPAVGRWGLDIVSLLNIPASVKPGIAHTNVCYLSGGSDREGGGRTKDLWVYYPDDPDAGHYIGPFTDTVPPYDETPVFNFHASWYVPWVGEAGAICVAGGVDHNHQIVNSTQCYDIGEQQFNERDADLGPLPEPWWGMADGWQMYHGRYQIWMANGVAQNGTLLPISVYADETTEGFQSGPEMPIPMYRGEGTGWQDRFYVVNGAQGGFNYSHHNQLLVHCPWCAEVDLPLVLRGYGN
jgi:hypothetical protein